MAYYGAGLPRSEWVDPRTLTADRAVGGAGFAGVGTGAGSPGIGGIGTGSGGIAQITQLINEINQAAQKAGRETQLPGQAALEQKNLANIQSLWAGEVPEDIKYKAGQDAAERGGISGSFGPNVDADYLRAIGLDRYKQLGIGSDLLSQAVGRNPAAPVYGAEHRFLTAEQEQQVKLAREQMANNFRIAQMHYANQGRGGAASPIRGASSVSPGISSSASNWAPIIKPDATPGWNFPPGYSSIPVGGGSNASTDDWENWFNENFPEEYTGGNLNNQFDYNFDDAFAGYA